MDLGAFLKKNKRGFLMAGILFYCDWRAQEDSNLRHPDS